MAHRHGEKFDQTIRRRAERVVRHGRHDQGEPVEVRLAKKEDRFRLNQDTHETLLAEDGTYIFDDVTDNQPPRQIEADEIDDRLGEDWHSDRGYMHQFLQVDNLF